VHRDRAETHAPNVRPGLGRGRSHNGNGCTGRIVNVLYLVNKRLLDIPVLYLSSQIMRSKPDHYRLLQAVRGQADSGAVWQEWVLYMLDAVEITAQQTIRTVTEINEADRDRHRNVRVPDLGLANSGCPGLPPDCPGLPS